MSSANLPYLLLFVSLVLVIFSGYNYFAKERVARRAANRRLALLETHTTGAATLDVLRRERGVFAGSSRPTLQRAQDWLTQSGLRVSRSALATAFFGFFVVVSMVASFALDFDLIAFPISFAVSLVAAVIFIHVMRKRRIAKFGQQLPEVLEMIVRSLRSGHPLNASVSLVAREMADPAGTEFGMVFDEVSYGLDMPTAIKNLARRVGDPDLLYLLTSVSVQAESGGNLAEILDRLSKTIRDRQKLRLKIGSMTAEGRLTAIVLTALPIVVIAVVFWISPDYFDDVWDNPNFVLASRVAAGLLVVGNVMIRRLVNFKY